MRRYKRATNLARRSAPVLVFEIFLVGFAATFIGGMDLLTARGFDWAEFFGLILLIHALALFATGLSALLMNDHDKQK